MRFLALLVLLFLANAPNMRLVTTLGQHRLARFIVVAFVKAQVLRGLLGRHRAFYDDGIQCCRQQ